MAVIKDVYADELKKRKFERVSGALCFRAVMLKKLVLQYQKELNEVNEKINEACEEFVNESK